MIPHRLLESIEIKANALALMGKRMAMNHTVEKAGSGDSPQLVLTDHGGPSLMDDWELRRFIV
jgi:hypothetical protein